MTSPTPPSTPTRPVGTRRRRLLVGGSLLLLAPAATLLALCWLQQGPEPALTPHEGPLPRAAAHRSWGEGGDTDGDGLPDELERAVAHRHAPRYRFAAHDPAGPDVRQNRDEEYLPLSVARFLAALEAGVFEVRGAGLVRTPTPGRFEEERVVGFPSRMPGEPVGEAPVYAHVYPGSSEGEVFCEYWVFYAYDRANAAFLGIPVPLGDHRGDWEHTAYRVRLDPPRVLEGFYYGHARCILATRDELELVAGEHPVVYVSQGKHASYPGPCAVPSTDAPTWLVQHVDVANGKGPTWDSWKGDVIDLGERDRPSPAAAAWLGFLGRWGPDGVEPFGLPIGTSPTGPLAKWSWRNNGRGIPWREHLAARGGTALLR